MDIRQRIEDRVRWLWLKWIIWRGHFDELHRRIMLAEVGLSGHVSLVDKAMADETGVRPLSRLQRWLARPVIVDLREHHRNAWREACIDVLGEDSEDWGE